MNLTLINDKIITSLKKIKISRIGLGIQSVNDETLKNIERRDDLNILINNIIFLRKNFPEVELRVDMMLGLPGDNLKYFLKGFNLVKKTKVDYVDVNELVILKGTKLYDDCKKFNIKYKLSGIPVIKSNYSFSERDINLAKEFVKKNNLYRDNIMGE